MKTRDFIILAAMIIIYIVFTTINYSIQYKTIEYKEKISELENSSNELMMNEKQTLSREKAIDNYDLRLNNENIYYLEEENE